jgi:nicotinate-nucleotide pyrophosphorylase (carboxylating)
MINHTSSKELAFIESLIEFAISEDIGPGDFSSLACINANEKHKAKLIVKENGILAGVEIAKLIFNRIDPQLSIVEFLNDGDRVKVGDIAFIVSGSALSILSAERLVLNIMQRMSGIATYTNQMVQLIAGTGTKLLDTRKTTPGFRAFEKMAVKIGGGENHRFGLYDMVMLKDNHIDFANGIESAIIKTIDYLKANDLNLKIEIEARNLEELKEILAIGGVHRIMLDNFNYSDLRLAVSMINNQYETEASGGITETTIRDYALCGVDYISVGALTHSVKSLDLSLKAVKDEKIA